MAGGGILILAQRRPTMKLPVLLSALAAVALVGAGVGVGPAAAQQQASAPKLAALHDALRLTPAQEDAWRAYQAAIAPDPAAQARHQAAISMMASLPTPRRVDLIDAEMQQNVQTIRRQGEAVKTFYAALSPSQQKIFDRETLQGASDQRGGNQGEDQPGLRQPPAGYGGPQP